MKLLFFILLFSVSIFPQEGKESLYSRGLRLCLEKEVSEYSKFSERDLQNVIVLKNEQLTDNLPTQLGKIKIQYLDNSELAQKYKSKPKGKEKTRDEIPFIKIFPIYDEDNKLFFAYNNYWFKYFEKGGWFTQRKSMSYYSLEGGCHAEIGYDPAERKFVIINVRLWGV